MGTIRVGAIGALSLLGALAAWGMVDTGAEALSCVDSTGVNLTLQRIEEDGVAVWEEGSEEVTSWLQYYLHGAVLKYSANDQDDRCSDGSYEANR